jgi:hypothetical protein
MDTDDVYPPRAVSPEYRHAPPLKSTLKAKEVAFDADSDDLEPQDHVVLPAVQDDTAAKEANLDAELESDTLVMQGLLSEGRRRGSVEDVDLEANPWLRKGGGLMAGIASKLTWSLPRQADLLA